MSSTQAMISSAMSRLVLSLPDSQALKKILKNLESRQLVKSTSSISSKTRKLYLLYDLEPAKEITGGPWYGQRNGGREE